MALDSPILALGVSYNSAAIGFSCSPFYQFHICSLFWWGPS